MKVLVVDDSKVVRVTVKKKLIAGGIIDVIEAESGDEALTQLHEIDVVVTDLNMPGISGAELLDRIRASDSGSKIGVILMTGRVLNDLELREFLARGFDGFVDKGASNIELQQVIKEVFNKRMTPKRFGKEAVVKCRPERVKLDGFNNLTKCLSFNLYDFAIARNDDERKEYLRYIDKAYSSERIAEISRGICKIIEAEVLDISKQDYDPYGASTLVLMSDLKAETAMGSSVHAHLNKSHICAHTYPDINSPNGICTFRVDIDIATCGEITPLKALNYMFSCFESDVVVMDYVVRGYTRDTAGRKVYNDLYFNSIRDFIDKDILDQYQEFEDLNIPPANTWQTKLLTRDLKIGDYFLNDQDLTDPGVPQLIDDLSREMKEIYYMHRV